MPAIADYRPGFISFDLGVLHAIDIAGFAPYFKQFLNARCNFVPMKHLTRRRLCPGFLNATKPRRGLAWDTARQALSRQARAPDSIRLQARGRTHGNPSWQTVLLQGIFRYFWRTNPLPGSAVDRPPFAARLGNN